jgi:hypothetical protein
MASRITSLSGCKSLRLTSEGEVLVGGWRLNDKGAFSFRYRDPLTGKWVRARYVAERHVIAERYKEREINGAQSRRSLRAAALVVPTSFRFSAADSLLIAASNLPTD